MVPRFDPSSTLLRIVAAVADRGSVSRAAEALHLSQPGVSYHLRQAEDAIGAPIFRREGRRMTLTPIGARLMRAAETVLEEIDQAERDIRRLVSGGEGVLRISSECFTSYHWLPRVLSRFKLLYPQVEVQVNVDSTRMPIRAVARGELDLALTTVPPVESGLRLTPLFDDEIVAIVPPSHRLARRRFLTPADFGKECVLVYDRRRSDLFTLLLHPAEVRPRQVLEIGVTEALVEMVKAGTGVGVLASWVVAPALEAGELIAVRLTRRGLLRQWTAVTSGMDGPPPHLDYFLSILREDVRSSWPAAPATRPTKRRTSRALTLPHGLPSG